MLPTDSRRAHSPSGATLSPAMHLQTTNRSVNPSQEADFAPNPITTCQSLTITFPQRSRGFPSEEPSERKFAPGTSRSSWIQKSLSSVLRDLSVISTTRNRSGSPGDTTWSLNTRPAESLRRLRETLSKISEENVHEPYQLTIRFQNPFYNPHNAFTPLPLCYRLHFNSI
jgi:hypothetical protein